MDSLCRFLKTGLFPGGNTFRKPIRRQKVEINLSGAPFLPAAKPRRSMDDIWPYDDLEIVAIRGQKSMITYVIEVTEFNFEVRSDLQASLEAVMASEAIGGNIHMNTG